MSSFSLDYSNTYFQNWHTSKNSHSVKSHGFSICLPQPAVLHTHTAQRNNGSVTGTYTSVVVLCVCSTGGCGKMAASSVTFPRLRSSTKLTTAVLALLTYSVVMYIWIRDVNMWTGWCTACVINVSLWLGFLVSRSNPMHRLKPMNHDTTRRVSTGSRFMLPQQHPTLVRA